MSTKRKAYDGEYVPHGNNENIFCYYELQFGKDLIVPGTLLKMKYDRDIYRFRLLAHNIKMDVQWVDVVNTTTGEWRAFYIDKIKNVVKPKKSRRKKQNNE